MSIRRARLPLPTHDRLGRILMLDPATRRCGVAVYVDGVLGEALTVHGRHPNHVVTLLAGRIGTADAVVIEVPLVYKGATARDKDLEGLREMVRLVRAASKRNGVYVYSVTPSKWKGNVPKAITARRALALLTEPERATLADTGDDTTDAIGLGLVALGRAKRGVV